MRRNRLKKRPAVRGHLIRWLIIVLGLVLWVRIYYPANPWSAEGAAEEALRGIQLPPAQIVETVDSGNGSYLLLLFDEDNRMFHQMYASRIFGLLWRNRGGGFGSELKPDVLLSFKSGMTTLDNRRHYYFVGQLHDPDVLELKIVWHDGLEQTVKPSGELYAASRSFPAKEANGDKAWDSKLFAYDRNGNLKYELNAERTEIIASQGQDSVGAVR
ncbi:hypothetical protein DVH26_08845 [Paenibacillus sp. H1-7]|uniref:hypothetical protein n=1 Tax=Paenibacillus sp. H1-7 TaxID=2282849 RepID=UPI001EF815D2|nr:hypothetical protein [Paenibacillus sp. H1-7]ULL14545.1 hypothetical protein DVH26_08845 [Paenibacillus sp. H1-7]